MGNVNCAAPYNCCTLPPEITDAREELRYKSQKLLESDKRYKSFYNVYKYYDKIYIKRAGVLLYERKTLEYLPCLKAAYKNGLEQIARAEAQFSLHHVQTAGEIVVDIIYDALEEQKSRENLFKELNGATLLATTNKVYQRQERSGSPPMKPRASMQYNIYTSTSGGKAIHPFDNNLSPALYISSSSTYYYEEYKPRFAHLRLCQRRSNYVYWMTYDKQNKVVLLHKRYLNGKDVEQYKNYAREVALVKYLCPQTESTGGKDYKASEDAIGTRLVSYNNEQLTLTYEGGTCNLLEYSIYRRLRRALQWYERELVSVAGEVAMLMQQLWDRELLHGNIKPENIVLLPVQAPKQQRFRLQLVDFSDAVGIAEAYPRAFTPKYFYREQDNGLRVRRRQEVANQEEKMRWELHALARTVLELALVGEEEALLVGATKSYKALKKYMYNRLLPHYPRLIPLLIKMLNLSQRVEVADLFNELNELFYSENFYEGGAATEGTILDRGDVLGDFHALRVYEELNFFNAFAKGTQTTDSPQQNYIQIQLQTDLLFTEIEFCHVFGKFARGQKILTEVARRLSIDVSEYVDDSENARTARSGTNAPSVGTRGSSLSVSQQQPNKKGSSELSFYALSNKILTDLHKDDTSKEYRTVLAIDEYIKALIRINNAKTRNTQDEMPWSTLYSLLLESVTLKARKYTRQQCLESTADMQLVFAYAISAHDAQLALEKLTLCLQAYRECFYNDLSTKVAETLKTVADLYRSYKYFYHAVNFYQMAIQNFCTVNENGSGVLCIYWRDLAATQFYQGEHQAALKSYSEALKLYESGGDARPAASLLRGIDLYTALASCNIALHRHEEALEQLKQAIAMYQGDETLTSKFEGSVKSLAKLYQKAAVCSEALKLYKDAVTQHNKAIELFVYDKTYDHSAYIVRSFELLAHLYDSVFNQPEQAQVYQYKANEFKQSALQMYAPTTTTTTTTQPGSVYTIFNTYVSYNKPKY